MALTDDLISQFAKITKDQDQSVKETTVYGTTVEYNGAIYVKLDGSELLTPVSSTTNTKADERVTVMIKNHSAIITGNLSAPAARFKDIEDVSDTITELEIAIADKVDTKELVAEQARIDALVADNVVIKDTLSSSKALIEDLQADNVVINDTLVVHKALIDELDSTKLDADVADITYATIADLEATDADIYNLSVTYGEFVKATAADFQAVYATIENLNVGNFDAVYATIGSLDAERARINNLEAEVADIDTLIFGSASGSTIQASFANAVIAQLSNAQIKSAMIESVSADKITAGDIITNNVHVMSEDGKLLISDKTIQISDTARVRVQIGKDSAGDYSINIWDADGKLMFSEGGITDSAIKSAIIRNDMVSDTANISAHKLNINSLFEEINGSTNTIKSSQIYLDDQAQKLNVAFNTIVTDVDSLQDDVTSHGTQLSVMQGQIESRVWQEDINTAIGDVSSTMNSQYSVVNQKLDGITATIANHTTQIANKADGSEVTEVNEKVSSLEVSLDGFKTSVRETYATKDKVASNESKINQNTNGISAVVSRVSSAETNIEKNQNDIASLELTATGLTTRVTNVETDAENALTNAAKAQNDVNNLEIGGRNLLKDTSFDGEAKRYERLENLGTEGGFHFEPTEQIESGVEYVLSLSMRGNANIVFYEINSSGGNFAHAWIRRTQLSETEFREFYLTFTVASTRVFEKVYICTQYGEEATAVGDWFELQSCSVKLERGNRKTDWTPAPEDMATSGDVTAVQKNIESVEERTTTNESVIQQLADSIIHLVTDGEGQSLMTQTEKGWTFSTKEIQDVVDATSEGLNDLVNEVEDVNSAVGILEQAVDELGVLNDYVKIKTYESEPCIELGETDSDFKLLITNTRILFMEGNDVPAYITNQALHIKTAVIEEELQQGGFLWKSRSNGNLGLVWKGV